MTMTSDRAAIVTALNTVSGVKAYGVPPTVLSIGDALVNLAGLERGPADVFLKTWVTHWLLAPDVPGAVAAMDTALPSVLDALDTVAYVQSVTPVSYQTTGATFGALEIRMDRE